MWRWSNGSLVPDYRLSEKGARMLTGFEAMILHVYLDQVGIQTVCVGHVVRPEDKAWIRDGVTRDECLQVLGRDVKRFEDGINGMVHVQLSQPMVDALVSLVFNIGLGAFAKSSVLAYLNQGRYSDAADAFTLWRFARVKQKDGSYQKRPILLGRREAEASLFRSGILEVHGAKESDGPTLETLLARAVAAQFGPLELVPYHLPIEPEPSDDELTEDGRLSCLPPRIEDCEPQAA
jgi:lysozyme